LKEAGETEVADADVASGGDHDVSGFEVTVNDPVLVEVEETVEKLEEDRLDHGGWDRATSRLSVVMYNLEEVVLTVLEDHKDTFVFEYDLG